MHAGPLRFRYLRLLFIALQMLTCHSVCAQDAWLMIPVLASFEEREAPLDALLAPWEKTLPRSVTNRKAARLYEERHSVASPELSDEARERAVAQIDQALRQLALGDLASGVETLRAIEEREDRQRDHLLHDKAVTQKLFDACIMKAYLLARQTHDVEAKEQLRACARSLPVHSGGRQAFLPVVHGPPQLKASFDEATKQVARERSGALSIASANERCDVYINGALTGETPLKLTHLALGRARVQLRCRERWSRVHRVTISTSEQNLQIEPRFDTSIVTQPVLQLRYRDPEQCESLMARDGTTVAEALGVDQIAFLVMRPRGNAWTVEVSALDPARSSTRLIGELPFSEIAGYEPKQLQRLVRELSKHDKGSHPANIALAAPPTPASDTKTSIPVADSPVEGETNLTVLGMTMVVGGAAALATSWALFLDRRSFRLQNWQGVTADVDAYARRGTWTVASLLLGAGALTVSPYFLVPRVDAVPTYAWVLGSVGLVAAAVGIGMSIGDEHCGPEAVLPLREPCRSIRADSLFGIEIALTALPLITLPLHYLLRLAQHTELSVDSHNRSVTLRVRGNL